MLIVIFGINILLHALGLFDKEKMMQPYPDAVDYVLINFYSFLYKGVV